MKGQLLRNKAIDLIFVKKDNYIRKINLSFIRFNTKSIIVFD